MCIDHLKLRNKTMTKGFHLEDQRKTLPVCKITNVLCWNDSQSLAQNKKQNLYLTLQEEMPGFFTVGMWPQSHLLYLTNTFFT